MTNKERPDKRICTEEDTLTLSLSKCERNPASSFDLAQDERRSPDSNRTPPNMNDFEKTLAHICKGRVGFLGIGNTDRADDGAGVILGRQLRNLGLENVYDGEAAPEKMLPVLRDKEFDSVVFLDAVDMALEPGAVAIFDAEEIVGRFPQVSTHKLSMGTLAQLVSDGNRSRVWLVGIQPKSIAMSDNGLSPEIAKTVQMLSQAIANQTVPSRSAHQEHACI